MAAHNLRAEKKLGQNFLFDLNLTGRIARAAGPLTDATIVEIGPGPGGLTRALLAQGAGHVVAVERDARCIAALAELEAHYPGRLTIVEGDALDFDPNSVVSEGPLRICANLPYNIATALLTRWLGGETWPPRFDRLVLMFQREVAERSRAALEKDRPFKAAIATPVVAATTFYPADEYHQDYYLTVSSTHMTLPTILSV